MTEETFVQLFWAIALPTGIGLLFVLAGAAQHLFHSPEYRHYLRLQRAKRTWAKMLTGERNETKT